MQADPFQTPPVQPAADPLDPAGLLARAEALEAEGRMADVQQIYQRLVQEHPHHPAVLLRRARVARQRGRTDKAAALLQQLIDGDPDDALLCTELALALCELDRAGEAEQWLRKALTLAPDFVDAHYNLGTVLEDLQRPEPALAAYLQAIALDPEHARALTRIGAILKDRGALKAALQHLDRAVAAAPESFQAQYYRGWVLSELRRHDEAIGSLRRARGLRPDSFEAELAIANALRAAGQLQPALDAYWALIEKNPRLAELHSNFSQLAWIAGCRDRFLRSFDLARQRLGDDPELMHLEAGLRLRSEDYAGAESLLRRALEVAPERIDLTGMLARALAAQGKLEQSYVLFTAAVQAQPDAMIHWQEFGLALLKGGRADQAQRLFERALGFAAYDQVVLGGLSLAYRELGDSRYQALVDFSRYVRSYDLPPPQDFRDVAGFNRSLAAEMDALHQGTTEPIDQTLRGGTQTSGQLFAERLPCIQHLYEAISAAVADYIRGLPADPQHPVAARRAESFRVAGSWSCRLRTGGYHNNHVHPQGWLSSAYYARLPEDFDYTGERLGWLKFGESNQALGGLDKPDYFVRPVIGRLVLFPSFYWHGTVPFPNNGDRLTVAFDVVPERAAAAQADGFARA
ncbi:MAG: tetratricopeptide repeat protein [Gammaproteobacteria bacterium]|nr:tetratricopeptide repeat protein [Gammaproteobacteria bacterium]